MSLFWIGSSILIVDLIKSKEYTFISVFRFVYDFKNVFAYSLDVDLLEKRMGYQQQCKISRLFCEFF